MYKRQIISGKGRYTVNGSVHTLTPGDAFLVYPNTEVIYQADAEDPWEYTWVGFTGSDAATILRATDFTDVYKRQALLRQKFKHKLTG